MKKWHGSYKLSRTVLRLEELTTRSFCLTVSSSFSTRTILFLSMREFMDTISPISLSKTWRRKHEENCTPQKLTEYPSLAEKLNYFGHVVLPASSLFSSKLQQCIRDLSVFYLKGANAALVQVKRLSPSLQYKSIVSGLEALNSAHLLSFSDTSTAASSHG